MNLSASKSRSPCSLPRRKHNENDLTPPRLNSIQVNKKLTKRSQSWQRKNHYPTKVRLRPPSRQHLLSQTSIPSAWPAKNNRRSPPASSSKENKLEKPRHRRRWPPLWQNQLSKLDQGEAHSQGELHQVVKLNSRHLMSQSALQRRPKTCCNSPCLPRRPHSVP